MKDAFPLQRPAVRSMLRENKQRGRKPTMSAVRKDLDRSGAVVMILLCAVLGLHQVAIKAAAPDMAPILQIALRSGLSALLVAITICCGKEKFYLQDGTLLPGFVAGLLFALEFLLVAEGLRRTSASHMSVFLYTAPVFTSLTLHWFLPAERLSRHQWAGVTVAFCGITLSFSGGLLQTGINADILAGDLMGLTAGVMWAATTVLIRCTRLSEAPPSKTLLYQLIVAFVFLLCYAIYSGQADRFHLSGIVWGSLLYQGGVVSFAAFLVWFSMLRRYNASQVSIFLFLSPLFGVAFGVLLLHEKIDIYFAAGSLLVLSGIFLVSRPRL